MDDPLHATIEEFATDGFAHVEYCPSMSRDEAEADQLAPPPSRWRLAIAQLSERLHCAECGGPVQSVKPWRLEDVLGKPLGRRG